MEKTESMAVNIATARKGAKVIGIGGVDVRSIQSLENAVARCVKELGGLDYCMYVFCVYEFITLGINPTLQSWSCRKLPRPNRRPLLECI